MATVLPRSLLPTANMISIGDVCALLNAFYTTYKGLKANQEECRRFHKHTQSVLERMDQECGGNVPKALQRRLAKFMSTLMDLNSTIDALKASSILKQIFMSSDISALITRAYEDIDSAAKELQFGLQLDVYKAQRENEEARREDSERTTLALEEVLTNESTMLKELTEHRIEMREALLFLQKTILQTTGSQRKALEQGIRTLQRCSSNISTGLQVPDEFVITSLEVVVHRHMRLGTGGFAEVYEADWNRTRVAVKVFPKGVMPTVLEREFKVWSRLRHPNILELFGACSFADPPFFVCALKANGDIMNYLQRNPDANRTGLLHQASLGLSYLHQRHIVHGDLKGANILVDEHGRACLADFGLSEIKHTTSFDGVRTAQGTSTYGTARWTSPEVLMGGPVTLASDVYSFSMTMYEVYTDSMPFANTPDALLLSVVHDRRVRPPRPAAEISKGMIDQIWALMKESWAHNPSDRPLAGQIAERLELYARMTASDPSIAHEVMVDEERFMDLCPAPPVTGSLPVVLTRRKEEERPAPGVSTSSSILSTLSSHTREAIPQSQDPAFDFDRQFYRSSPLSSRATSLIVNVGRDTRVRVSSPSHASEDHHELNPRESSPVPRLTGQDVDRIRNWRNSVPTHADPNIIPPPIPMKGRSASHCHPHKSSVSQPQPSALPPYSRHRQLEIPPHEEDAEFGAGSRPTRILLAIEAGPKQILLEMPPEDQGPVTVFPGQVDSYGREHDPVIMYGGTRTTNTPSPTAPVILCGNPWEANAQHASPLVVVRGARGTESRDPGTHAFRVARDAQGTMIIGEPERKGFISRLKERMHSNRINDILGPPGV